jgi:hypothetical protein
MKPFALMTPAARLFAVEQVISDMLKGADQARFPGLSDATKEVMRRLELALVDEHCTTSAYTELSRQEFASVPDDDVLELHYRLLLFAAIRDLFPLEARTPEEAFPAVAEGLQRRIELEEALK